MICPTCAFEYREVFDFCPKCGTPLHVSCPQCGYRAPADFSFCPTCGTALRAAPAAVNGDTQAVLSDVVQRLVPREFAERLLSTRGQVQAERRIVTSLFCDVTGSTAMAEELDPEDVMEVMDGAFDILIEPIYRYEGTLARLMGDAVLAFFGAPISHEDDPERAVRAALEIVEGAKEYSAKLEQERGIEGFNVRVGINTGLVVVGEIGSDLRVEYTAMGDAVNLAARMEQNAPTGRILITHDTYRAVRGVFDVQPREPLRVKGKSEPVQTYLVERAKPRAFRVARRGVEGIETRMVGREVELLALKRVLEDVIEDAETRVITVVGDAGVGKTRLSEEFFDWFELRSETAWYFKGGAASTTQAVPYRLWRSLFGYRFQILESDSGREAMEKFRAGMAGTLGPERADLVGQLVGFDFAAAGSEAVQALMGSANFGQLARAYLVRYFRRLLERYPVVMLLEDLQWADDSSLDLVAHVVSEAREAGLLVVGTARPALFERRPNWGEGEEAYRRLDLEPLAKRASRGLVEEILQKAVEVPEELRELILEGAEGNPYYVEELIKMLIEDGVIVRGEPQWQVEEERLAEVRVPATLRAVVQARLDALPQGEKEVLRRASVVGRAFWDRLVAELVAEENGRGHVGSVLGALRARELIFQRERSSFAGAREYTFKHSVLRDVTYETMLLRERRRCHAQVAAWLETHAGERLGEYLGMIARHYELAGERAEAGRYLRRSGEEAYKVNAFRDAAVAFERALGLLPDGDEAERAAVMVMLGQAEVPLQGFEQATHHLEVGLELARGAGERATEVAALNGLGEVAWRQGDWEAARRYLHEALGLAQECEDVGGQALAVQHLARVSWLLAEHEQAKHWAQESEKWYRHAGDRQGVISARNELAIAAMNQKQYDKARDVWTDNLSVAGELGDRFRVAQALVNLGTLARMEGAYDEARIYFEEARGIHGEVGDRLGAAMVKGRLGDLCIQHGKDEEAWGYLRGALQEVAPMGDVPHILLGLTAISRLWLRAGRLEHAAELLGLALHHTASYFEVEQEAQPVVEALREALGAEGLEAALARGAKLELEQVVEEILHDV